MGTWQEASIVAGVSLCVVDRNWMIWGIFAPSPDLSRNYSLGRCWCSVCCVPPVLTMCGVTAPVLCSAPRHLSRTCRRQPGRGEHRQRGFIIMQLRRCGIKLARKKFLLRQSCKLCFCKLMTKRCSMAPSVARIVAIYTMRSVATQHVGLISGYPTCPRVSVVQVQWTRGAGGRRSAVVAGAGQECSLQISSQ